MPAGSSSDYSSLHTPPKCTADFCLIPIGTPSASVSKYIIEVQKLVRGHGLVKDGTVKWSMHSAGTTLEGSWDNVTKVMGQAHQLLHDQGVVRIQTDIRIGSRTDKKQSMQDKVDAVEKFLSSESAGAEQDGGEEPGTRHESGTTTDAPNSTNLRSEVSSVIPDE
ncbi:hypothetical protein BT93_L4247 [Corymbia citriodora subsp. variegata]|uniref:Thiamine-binding protein domain-containing protein n=1 Tax=Corymbia citriodora subsp. variegata TaxID=360336 RepID=A0A8T0CKF0_CORYI|nr:hypothetical protein BT93_L4247 [Corymbia citriodora subsp. variegata]